MQEYLHMIFIDLKKVYDRVSREILLRIVEEKGVRDEFIQAIKDTYDPKRPSSAETIINKIERPYVYLRRKFSIKPAIYGSSILYRQPNKFLSPTSESR